MNWALCNSEIWSAARLGADRLIFTSENPRRPLAGRRVGCQVKDRYLIQ